MSVLTILAWEYDKCETLIKATSVVIIPKYPTCDDEFELWDLQDPIPERKEVNA